MDYQLRQGGRSRMEMAAGLTHQLITLGRSLAARASAAGLDEQSLADDLAQRDQQIRQVAEQVPEFRVCNLIRDWYCDRHGPLAIEAFEELGKDLSAALDQYPPGKTTLDPNDGYEVPAWWSDHWIHRTRGGWDGHRHMGFIYGEFIVNFMVSRITSGDLLTERLAFAALTPDGEDCHLVEVGCGSGHFTRALSQARPRARITACDISLRQLEHAQRTLNAQGAAVQLKRCSGEDTGLADASADAVVSYAVLHEMPAGVTAGVFREAFRLLKPGGMLLFADVPPYSELDKFAQWRADFSARQEGEPYWRQAATLDVAGILTDLGFEQVERFGMNEGPYPYPYVTRARKPDS